MQIKGHINLNIYPKPKYSEKFIQFLQHVARTFTQASSNYSALGCVKTVVYFCTLSLHQEQCTNFLWWFYTHVPFISTANFTSCIIV